MSGKNSIFSESLKAARNRAHLTQEQVANELGTKAQNYSQYERGLRNPKQKTVEKLAQILNAEYAYTKGGEPFLYNKNLEQFNSGEEFKKAWDELAQQPGMTAKNVHHKLTDNDMEIISHMTKLNEKGQEKAIEQVELLTKIPEYQKDT